MDRDSCPNRSIMNAAIDIGTNTVLLLVAEPDDDKLTVIEEQQRIPRLGRGVDHEQNLSQDSMDRVIEALKEYKSIIIQEYPSAGQAIVTATSAVRDAQNRQEFLRRVQKETAFDVKVLSGFEEALYTFRGAQSVLSVDSEQNYPMAVLDIGGGSTEIAIGEEGKITDRHSFDMGCVRFTERFLDTSPVQYHQMTTCKEAVIEMLKEYSFDFSSRPKLIGVAGTITSLAFMQQGLKEYESEQINGHYISVETAEDYITMVRDTPSETLIEQYPTVMKGRADIFLAGLLILQTVMEYYDIGEVTVSTGGIRHGAVLLNTDQ